MISTCTPRNAARFNAVISEESGRKYGVRIRTEVCAEANAANERINVTNQRVSAVDERVTSVDNRLNSVDEYEAKNSTNINFRVNSALLSKDAKTALDEIAAQAKNEKGFVIQVAGFASADGGKEYNRRLSERRANAVIRYLMENHDIPQRRIITPYGFGELKPAADNATRDGREQNRRVEVAILVSKGLAASAAGADKSASQRTSNLNQQQ